MGGGWVIDSNEQIGWRSSTEKLLHEGKSTEWDEMERTGRDKRVEFEQDCNSEGQSAR